MENTEAECITFGHHPPYLIASLLLIQPGMVQEWEITNILHLQ